jgi:hypothetical protein
MIRNLVLEAKSTTEDSTQQTAERRDCFALLVGWGEGGGEGGGGEGGGGKWLWKELGRATQYSRSRFKYHPLAFCRQWITEGESERLLRLAVSLPPHSLPRSLHASVSVSVSVPVQVSLSEYV